MTKRENKRSREMSELDYKYNDNCICPYCGYEDEASWEVSSRDTIGMCGSCGKKFGMEQIITRAFSTWKTCQTKEDCEFCDWKPYIKGESIYRTCKICGNYEYQKPAPQGGE